MVKNHNVDDRLKLYIAKPVLRKVILECQYCSCIYTVPMLCLPCPFIPIAVSGFRPHCFGQTIHAYEEVIRAKPITCLYCVKSEFILKLFLKVSYPSVKNKNEFEWVDKIHADYKYIFFIQNPVIQRNIAQILYFQNIGFEFNNTYVD